VELVAFILSLALVGLVVGGLGRLALPGRDPMRLWQTSLVGIAGSLVAGLVGSMFLGRGVAPFALAVLFATGIVYLIRRSRGGRLSQPGRDV
jgi:uncharacterized membrane protein YeaQ/YmgE (transglycosylase-associated protein family)